MEDRVNQSGRGCPYRVLRNPSAAFILSDDEVRSEGLRTNKLIRNVLGNDLDQNSDIF